MNKLDTWVIASCDLDGTNLGLRVYKKKPYWASKDVNWKYFDVVKLSDYENLQDRILKLESVLQDIALGEYNQGFNLKQMTAEDMSKAAADVLEELK